MEKRAVHPVYADGVPWGAAGLPARRRLGARFTPFTPIYRPGADGGLPSGLLEARVGCLLFRVHSRRTGALYGC